MTDLDIILSKYASGEALPVEAGIAETWINESEENKKEFLRWIKIIEAPGPAGQYAQANTIVEWRRFRVKTGPSYTAKLKNILPYCAAVLIIVVTLVFSDKNKLPSHQLITIRNTSSSTLDTNINAEKINIDTMSEISFENTESEKGGKRIVRVLGDIFINIAPGQKEYNVYAAGQTQILPVHQASFFISYDSGTNIAQVHVESGNVLVKYKKNSLQLLSKQAVRISDSGIEKIPVNKSLYAYAVKFLDFRDTPLQQAFVEIEKAYKVSIKTNFKNFENCRISALFDNKALPEVLDVMAHTLNFEYVFSNNRREIIISGDGCK